MQDEDGLTRRQHLSWMKKDPPLSDETQVCVCVCVCVCISLQDQRL
jgi:hypothetical protein